MRKRALSLICLIAVFAALLCPTHVHAAALDPDAESSLTLTYTREGITFGGLEISIYRIAEAYANGNFGLI